MFSQQIKNLTYKT